MMSVQALNVYWLLLSESIVLGVVSDTYLPVFEHLFPGWIIKKYSDIENPTYAGDFTASAIIDFRSDELSKIILKTMKANQKFYFDFSGERKIVNLNERGEIKYFETVKIKDHVHEIGTEISAWKIDVELITTYINLTQDNYHNELQKPATSNIRNVVKDANHEDCLANVNILIFPCGTTDAKKWPIDNWHILIDELIKRDIGVKIFLGPSESSYQKRFDGKAQVYINQPWSSIIKNFDRNTLVISNDCGPMHVAGTMGCSLIALFGPTNEKVWFTYQSTGIALKKTEKTWPSVADVLSAISTFEIWKQPKARIN